LRISLEQWLALVAVVEGGGFAQAAVRLNKTQSTISYAVRKIESQLDLKLFEIQGRKAVLTPAGQALYRRGRALVDEAERVEKSAADLARGWEAELRLAVETIFPTWLLLECMERFSAAHPDIRIELYETVLEGTNELLLEGQVELAITSSTPSGFLGDPLMQARAIAAAAPSHPLHHLGRDIGMEDLRAYRHLVIRDSGARRGKDPAWHGANQRWTVSHKATSIRAACMGLGFAWFAEEIIREELDSGALKPLPLIEGAERWGMLYLVYADADAKGPGVTLFGELLRDAVRQCPTSVEIL
jgi:DNA-binding transcriptional LysR family regulator